MKNKLFKPILLSIMALSLIGCESNDTADKNLGESQVVEAHDEEQKSDNKPIEDKTSESEAEDTEDKKEDENKKEAKVAEKEEEKNLHDKDGKYVTTMIAKLKGEADDYITSTAYEYKFEDDRFVVSGSFDYLENPEDYEKVEEIENEEDHKFVINDKTVFQAVGGMAKPEIFTKEDFLKYLEECKDTGLALIIFVEDGVATSVSISS